MHRTVPTTKNDLDPNVYIVEVEKPRFRSIHSSFYYFFSQTIHQMTSWASTQNLWVLQSQTHIIAMETVRRVHVFHGYYRVHWGPVAQGMTARQPAWTENGHLSHNPSLKQNGGKGPPTGQTPFSRYAILNTLCLF